MRGLYLHVPFCFHKCHYCDFYSIVDALGRHEQFVHRLLRERDAAAEAMGDTPETIFVGGGTPTLLPAASWRELLAGLASSIGPGLAEFTVEANPETVTGELLDVLVAGGVTRISIGAQSFQPAHLQTLERWHDPENVARSVERARAAGLRRVSLDLIFGIPGQTVDDWADDLARALALEPDHLSCYGLTYEPNTPMTIRLRRGDFEASPDETTAAMYELTRHTLALAGYEHYEISNWARPGERCRHNLLYWTNRSWWPLGPGAAGHVGGVRWKNAPRLSEYLESSGLPPITDVERVDADGVVGERLMLGLRLIDGLPLGVIDELLATGGRGSTRAAAIAKHEDAGRLERANGRLRLTETGQLLADLVLVDLI
ncbi:MAG: radical SAM family heme chaperone HemW [Phycisphaerales bacterium]|nr:radical SAM family heme chaperone HemW [Phycisphaerales bacterium]